MTDFSTVLVARLALIFISAWLVMLLLPPAFGLTWGYDQVLAITVIISILGNVLDDQK